jgi:hypothetical protein
MISINSKGLLVLTSNSGKYIPVTGIIFMDNIYALKCQHLALTNEKEKKDRVLDDVLKFAIK